MNDQNIVVILEAIKKLAVEVSLLRKNQVKKTTIPLQLSSEKVDELYGALAKAQGEFTVAQKDKDGVSFKSGGVVKYADLAGVFAAARAALSKHELAVIQAINVDEDGDYYLHSTLTHSSGQWIRSVVRLVPSRNDIHGLASTITYMRRYTFSALVGVVVEDEDDDGAEAMKEQKKNYEEGVEVNHNMKNKRKPNYTTVTSEQLDELKYEIGDFKDIAQGIMETYDIAALALLPKDAFRSVIRQVRNIVQIRTTKKE